MWFFCAVWLCNKLKRGQWYGCVWRFIPRLEVGFSMDCYCCMEERSWRIKKILYCNPAVLWALFKLNAAPLSVCTILYENWLSVVCVKMMWMGVTGIISMGFFPFSIWLWSKGWIYFQLWHGHNMWTWILLLFGMFLFLWVLLFWIFPLGFHVTDVGHSFWEPPRCSLSMGLDKLTLW